MIIKRTAGELSRVAAVAVEVVAVIVVVLAVVVDVAEVAVAEVAVVEVYYTIVIPSRNSLLNFCNFVSGESNSMCRFMWIFSLPFFCGSFFYFLVI